MAFDFPKAPVVGEEFTSENFVYIWDGVAWNLSGGTGTTGISDAPRDQVYYARKDGVWTGARSIGDVKSGFQTADHDDWIKLDGRAVSTLTPTQQIAASTLGFTANLPNGQLCSLRMDTAAVLGVVGGSAKITVANLPAHNMTSGNSAVLTSSSSGAHTHTTDAQGAHTVGTMDKMGVTCSPVQSQSYSANNPNVNLPAHTHTALSAGAHTHTVPAHNHTVALGGSGTDYYAKAMVVNFFVYLGA